MTFEEIVNAAREATGGLLDPDNDSWRMGLELLLRDHAATDILNERGRAMLRARYVEALATRMQVDDYVRHNPHVVDAPIERPVFILGMPRTGTTMVSYLLNGDPANRSLLKWEAYKVTPPAAPGALQTDPRCLAEKAKMRRCSKPTQAYSRSISKRQTGRPNASTWWRKTSGP